MPLLQLQARLRPPDIDLSGKAAIVTGANGGIGLETARQLMLLNASIVILAVRSIEKGEAAKISLLADRNVQAKNATGEVRVMKLDMADYQSVWEFANSVKVELAALHVVVLNAAVANLEWSKTSSGHEQISQVNYFSNVLLLLELLPHLEMTARKTGQATRLTWVSSRAFMASKLAKHIRIEHGQSVFGFLDDPKNYGWFMRYPDSKLLAASFVREFSRHQDAGRVIVNDVCPGMVDTSISNNAPAYFRKPVAVITKITARTAEQGAWAVMHAAVVAGPESHGKFLVDQKEISSYGVLESGDGQRLRQQLWKETAAEMGQQGVVLPAFMEEDPVD